MIVYSAAILIVGSVEYTFSGGYAKCDSFTRNQPTDLVGGRVVKRKPDNWLADVRCNPQPPVNGEQHYLHGSDWSSIREAR